MFGGMTGPAKPPMNVLPPRQVWFPPGCRPACVRKSIKPLVLITPTYISQQINDTAEKGRSIGDKVKVSPLPAGLAIRSGGGPGQRDGESSLTVEDTDNNLKVIFITNFYWISTSRVKMSNIYQVFSNLQTLF